MIPLKVVILNKPKKVRRQIIAERITGTIVLKDNEFLVRCALKDVDGFENGIRFVRIDSKSFETKGKTTVYIKDPNRKGCYVKIIRFKSEAMCFRVPNAYPFRPGFTTKGNIINVDDKLYFRITNCCHPSQLNNDGSFKDEDNIIIDE